MNTRLMVAAVSVALGIAGSVAATSANACGVPDYSQNAVLQAAMQGNLMVRAEPSTGALAPDAAGTELDFTAQNNGVEYNHGSGSIVGLWIFTFTSKGNSALGIPDGATIDTGLQMWHDDGTEFTNSGGRIPEIGNVCLGVWTQKGDSSYKLTHWGLAWNGTSPNTFLGPSIIRESSLKVDRTGNNFSGNFTIDQYLSVFTPPMLPNLTDLSHPLVHIGGTVTATRITPD